MDVTDLSERFLYRHLLDSMVWWGWVLWYIKHGYLMSNPLYTHTHTYIYIYLYVYIYVEFWPSPRPKMPFKVMHRKEVTHSNGSYERKSCGRKLADEMGQGKKSHDTLIDWYTGREWPVNCMTVISAWWRSNMPFQRLSGRLSGRWTII